MFLVYTSLTIHTLKIDLLGTFAYPVHEAGVHKLLRELKIHKASGVDQLSWYQP